MKILFVRHGESEDDLINAYGGWADFPITENGETQIEETTEKIKDLKIHFELCLHSPLKRAKSTGEIIAKNLKIPMQEFLYVKERNTYGLLCGVNKDEALKKYPELVKAYEDSEYVVGQERNADIEARVQIAWDKILEIGKGINLENGNIIVVTHGNFLKAFVKVVLGKKLVKKVDGGFVLVEVTGYIVEIVMEGGIEVR